jgi:photosystem II stability/assembly factor-like uncharacterized protein
MKKFFILFPVCIFCFNCLFAQWQHVNGPYSGSIHDFISKDSKIFALTIQGGVFVSSDNGNTWTASHEGETNPVAYCATIKGNRIYLGTIGGGWEYQGGLFSSDDNGASWNTILINGSAIVPVKAAGSNTQSVFIISNDTLYRSDNDGISWTKLRQAYTLGVNGNTVFAGGVSTGLSRSLDNGATFTDIDISMIPELYVPSSFLFEGSAIYVCGSSGLVFKSTDNGDTWSSINHATANFGAIKLAASGNKLYAGCYKGQLWNPPPTDGGIYYTQDDGVNWNCIGLKGYSIYALIISGNRIIAGTMTEGIFISDDNGATWVNSNNNLVRLGISTIAQCGSDLFVSCKSMHSYYSENPLLYTLRSQDNTVSWEYADSGLSVPFMNVFADGGSFILAGGYCVYISYNHGSTWQQIFNPGLMIYGLLVSGTHIFAGTEGAGVFLSDDQGLNWRSVNKGLENFYITSLIMKGSILFAGTHEGLYRSSDFGSNWEHVNNGLGALSVNAMTADNNYVYTDNSAEPGIFRSADDGNTWTCIPFGINTSYPASSLACSNGILIATLGDNTKNVLYSNDNGDTWSVSNSGLEPGYPFYAVLIKDSTVYTVAMGADPSYSEAIGLWKRALSDFVPFTVTDTLLMKETSGDVNSLTIISETPWNFTGNLPSWISVNKSYGSASETLLVTTTEANPNQEPRYASLNVVSEGISRHCAIVQKPKLNGIEDSFSQCVGIFPNPTSGNVTINNPGGYDKLYLYSIRGEILFEQNITSQTIRLDLSQYGQGVYYIRLEGKQGSCIREVIAL